MTGVLGRILAYLYTIMVKSLACTYTVITSAYLLITLLGAIGVIYILLRQHQRDQPVQLYRRPDNKGPVFEKSDLSRADEARYVYALSTALNTIQAYPRGAAQLTDYLYIGDMQVAMSKQRLASLGITHVINCAEEYVPTGKEFYGDSIQQYVGFAAEDDDNYNMIQHFDEAYDVIDDARTSGGKAYIHCMMGINRSGLLAVAYYMLQESVGPITAAVNFRRKRGFLLSNRGFQNQLVHFANTKGLLQKDSEYLIKYKMP